MIASQGLVSIAIPDRARPDPSGPHEVAVFAGEGVGPDVVAAALGVLAAVEAATDLRVALRAGGPIGVDAEATHGVPLPEHAADLCGATLERGGAVLCGPGGGRFVYDLRRRFDLFCKLVPLKVHDELLAGHRLRADHVRGVDLVVVRDNAGGVYQGTWSESIGPRGRVATHAFGYEEPDVRRIVQVAARLAAARRGDFTVVLKDGGVPSVSRLWRDCAREEARALGVRADFANVDLVAYQLIQDPRGFDVVVTPNLFGDVLADLGSVLEGSRGLSFSGNFTPTGAGVYQTNHGAAYDLVGTDRANPVAQIFSLAMLLRESFGRAREAAIIEDAVRGVWRAGFTTADLPSPERRVVGTRELALRVADEVALAARRVGDATRRAP